MVGAHLLLNVQNARIRGPFRPDQRPIVVHRRSSPADFEGPLKAARRRRQRSIVCASSSRERSGHGTQRSHYVRLLAVTECFSPKVLILEFPCVCIRGTPEDSLGFIGDSIPECTGFTILILHFSKNAWEVWKPNATWIFVSCLMLLS